MESYLLHMGKTQMIQAWNVADFDQYRNILGDVFHDKIKQFYAVLESTDIDALKEDEHSEFMEYFELIKDWVTLLHYHKADSYPEELVYSLNLVMREWLDNYSDFVVLISDNPYSVTHPLSSIDAIYQNIELRYCIHFNEKIVKITMPIEHCSDYLVNVSLYHEIGHYIDNQRGLRWWMFNSLLAPSNNTPAFIAEIQHFFPFYNHPLDEHLKTKFLRHSNEYIADLFSAQYTGEDALVYLKYLRSHNPDIEGEEHPRPALRYEMIDAFLKADNVFIALLRALVPKLYKNRSIALDKKYDLNIVDKVGTLSAIAVGSEHEMHSLYSAGWKLYKMDNATREANYPATKGLSRHDLYLKLNEVIGSSIGEYSKNNPFA